MKKVLKFVKQNVLGLIIGVIVGGSAIVIADSLISSSQVTFDKTNSEKFGATATYVDQAIDELYDKASYWHKDKIGYLPNQGTNIRLTQSTFVQNLQVGDLIKMTPTHTSVRLSGSKSGFSSSNGATSVTNSGVTYYPYDDNAHPTYLNPSELEYWRVIRKNDDGTVDVVSEYVSSISVYFRGTTGYANFVGYLNELASYYENDTYTVGSRMMGYNGQTQYITNTSAFDGTTTATATKASPIYPGTTSTSTPTSGTVIQEEYLGGVLGDTLYYTDYDLVKVAYGNNGNISLIAKSASDKSTAKNYWLASRRFIYSNSSEFYFNGRGVNTSVGLNSNSIRYYASGWIDISSGYSVRPILTLKSTITSSSTETLNGETVYVLD